MRIGLIAMSGVRACDPELLRLGLTLPGVVERSRVIARLPSLGLLTLAGCTPAGHEVFYREVEDVNALGDALERFDLVAISTFTAQVGEAYELADRYRQIGVPVAMGGLHVTVLPAEALQHADAVCVGEGEVCWPAMVRAAEQGAMRGVYSSRSGSMAREFDLSLAPMPRFDLLDVPRYNRITVQTSRGCPWRCEFCASSILLTGKYKQKPVATVLAEIDRIIKVYESQGRGRPFIEFADDNSVVNREWWKSFLRALIDRNVRWFTETDISVAEEDEVLELMRKSGCVEVLIGLESPVEAGLHNLELRSNWKLKKLPGYVAAVRNIQQHGIRVNGCFVLGLDGQDVGVFDRVYEAACAMELFDVQVTLQTPFPGTPLHDRLRREGRLLHENPWKRCTLFDLTFEPLGMTRDQLQTGFRDLVARLYSDAFTRFRHDTFSAKYLCAPERTSPLAKDPAHHETETLADSWTLRDRRVV